MKKYQIIYADPPYHYRNYADQTASRWVGNQYSIMSVRDLCALPVATIADKDCALFLWTTAPCLQEAMGSSKEGMARLLRGIGCLKRNLPKQFPQRIVNT